MDHLGNRSRQQHAAARNRLPKEDAMKFEEHDLVVLTADVPEHRLRAGDLGTVVHRYDEDMCEVEFTTAAGSTVAVVALPTSLLRAAAAADIAAVRTA